MFNHIVLMRLSGADAEFHRCVEDYAARVRNELSYVRGYAYAPNLADRSGGYDWVITSTFDTAQDHDRYQVSAVHVEMKGYMAPFIEALIACDLKTG